MPYVHAADYKKGSSAVIYTAADGSRVLRLGGPRSWRNNNPGNMRFTEFARDQGAIGTAGKFAVFPSVEIGRPALFLLLRETKYLNLSISKAISRYAPPEENDTDNYERLIAKLTGLDVTRKLSDLNATEFLKVVSAIEKIEGYTAGKEMAVKGVLATKTDGKHLTRFLIEGESIYIPVAEAIRRAELGEIGAVVVRTASGGKYLRARADGVNENNFSSIAEIDVES